MNIIRLRENMIETDEDFYMIFDLCNLGDLSTYLDKKAPLTENEA